MQTIEIYKNYGVLAAEKRNVYTFGAEHPHAAQKPIAVEL